MSYTRAYSDQTLFPVRQVKNSTAASFDIVRTLVGSRTGEKVIDWRERIRSGIDATSPFSCNRYSYVGLEPGSASLRATIPGNPGAGTQTQSFSGFAAVPAEVVAHLVPAQPKAEADALTRLYRKIKREQSQLAGASSLAEFGDVLRQFGAPLAAIVDLTNRRLNRLHLEARGLRGSIAFRKLKFAEIVASTYLEYAFGLAPLINDTRKAAEAYARFQLEAQGQFKLVQRSKLVARGEDEVASHSTQNTVAGSTWFGGINVTKTVTKTRVQYVVGVAHTLQAQFGSSDRLLQLLGFTPKDWIPAAWEVIPWSWLVDYFTNVGDILSAAATNTADVTWVCKTTSQSTISTNACSLDPKLTALSASPWVPESVLGTHLGNTGIRRTTVSRVPGVQLSVPPLVFSLPSEWGQYANMVATLLIRRPKSSALWLY